MPSLANFLAPRGRGGGGHGSSSSDGTSSPGTDYTGSGSSSYGTGSGSSTGSSTGSSGYGSSTYTGSSGSKSSSSTFSIWALVLLITVATISLIFKISLIYFYRQERKKNPGNLRHAHVIKKALKIAFFLWIPIGLYRLCTGRKRKANSSAGTSNASGSYTKIDQGQQGIVSNNNNNTTPWHPTQQPQTVIPASYPYTGAAGAGYMPVPVSVPVPVQVPAVQQDTPPPYGYSHGYGYKTEIQTATGGGGGAAQEYYSGQNIMPTSVPPVQTSPQAVYQAPPVQIHSPYPMYAPGR